MAQKQDRDVVEIKGLKARGEGEIVCWAEGRLAKLLKVEPRRIAFDVGNSEAAAVDDKIAWRGRLIAFCFP